MTKTKAKETTKSTEKAQSNKKANTMPLSVLVGSQESFLRLLDRPMKGSFSFRLKKIAQVVMPHLESYEEVRQELVKKYGKKQEDDNYRVEPGTKKWQKFVDELTELQKEEVEVKIEKMPTSAFKTMDISTNDLLALDWMVEDE